MDIRPIAHTHYKVDINLYATGDRECAEERLHCA